MQQRPPARKTSIRVHRDNIWPQFKHEEHRFHSPRPTYQEIHRVLETEIVDRGQRLSRQPPYVVFIKRVFKIK